MTWRWACGLVITLGVLSVVVADQPGQVNRGPLSPREELATFRLPKGFRAELVAAEPEVIDPVAMAFDEEGRLFVAEMRGYPNDGVATGKIHSGRIRRLEDKDGDGVFETSTIFAEGLRFPNSVMPWRGGLLASVAPDILYFEDLDGDGKADRHRSLYTGFDLSNIQQLVNGLQWGLDNWVHGCVGSKGGTVTSVEKPNQPAVELRSRHIRFHPDRPGSLEPTSGGGQFGLSPTDGQHWFTATNSQHLRHIVLPDHYLRRNPALAVSTVILDVPDHGAACKVQRISPFEDWRVERTRRRKEGADARRFAATELVPGGYITSGCSPLIYTARRFPAPYQGNSFVCDPANNLIHRDVLVPKGGTYVAQRGEVDCEFLASTDNWFRPVNLMLGPDGAIYLADFYREAIETPLSLPPDLKKQMNLESRGRGRIWRIVPEGTKPGPRPALGKLKSVDLVPYLAHDNSWWRLTAQRLLVERQDKSVAQPLQQLARDAQSPVGRFSALWTLQGLQCLETATLERALTDSAPEVREQALRLAEDRLSTQPSLQKLVANLAEDPSDRVRFQAAFTLGEMDGPLAVAALARIARSDGVDPWTQTALLSSAGRCAAQLLRQLVARDVAAKAQKELPLSFLGRLATIVGARQQEDELALVLGLLQEPAADSPGLRPALLDGLGQGMQNSNRPLSRLWENPPPALKEAVTQATAVFDKAAGTARDDARAVPERSAALRLLAYGPYRVSGTVLKELLSPRQPAEVQLAALRGLALQDRPEVGDTLIGAWSSASPGLRREILEALFARPQRITRLLDALEAKTILPNQLDALRQEQLRKHPQAAIRNRAGKLLGSVASDRQKVLEANRTILDLAANASKGKAIFKQHCATCHRLENVGQEVGPDLLATLRNKNRETLLTDILDPSREVDPRYVSYLIETREGRVLTGLIAVETASSVTLRRAERVEDTLLRSQIEQIQATSKSLMPEGFETQIPRQDIADLIAYLQEVGAR